MLSCMAAKTFVKFYSDLSGEEIGESAETLFFSFAGMSYEIDLTAKERAEFERVLSKYLEAARPARASGRGARATSGLDPKVVRAWAIEAGLDVPSRGRIPKAIVDAYRTAQ